MIFENIKLGKNVNIDPSSVINNVIIGDNVKIAKRVTLFGSSEEMLEIGNDSYIGMNCFLHGYAGKVKIGCHVSFAQNVILMTDSGPNASKQMQRIFSIISGNVTIGDHSWIGAHSIIMPGIKIGKFSVVAANSFVNIDVPDFSICGGTPAKIIRRMSKEEIDLITKDSI